MTVMELRADLHRRAEYRRLIRNTYAAGFAFLLIGILASAS